MRFRGRSKWIPYAGAGIGRYAYSEQSPGSDPGENVSISHIGELAHAGVERTLRRRLVMTADLQFTHIGGILGMNGVSAQVGEHDLGGIAARVRLLVLTSR
jgi:hypothetical protein